MKYIFTLLVLILSARGYCQEVKEIKRYNCKNGWRIERGGTLILGRSKTGTYKNIVGSTGQFAGSPLSGNYEDSVYKISNLTMYEKDRGGFAWLNIGGVQFILEVEPAIVSGELKIPDEYSAVKPSLKALMSDLEAAEEHYVSLIDSIPFKEGKIFYDKVLQAPGIDKKKLFNCLRQWLVENFVDSRGVLEVSDPDAGLLTGKGIYQYQTTVGVTSEYGQVRFIISFAVKDGKFRYQLYSFMIHGTKKELDIFSYTGVKRTELDYPMDEAYSDYNNGKRKDAKFAKQNLMKMVWLAEYINSSLSYLAAGNVNDIADFE